MSRMEGVRRLLRITRNRAGIERAVDDELRFHFEMTMRDLMNNGMSPDEARKEAERRFGSVEHTRRRLSAIDRSLAAEQRRAEWWDAFAQDLRYALRGLRLKPGFALAVITTLALGIGANATMFGIVDQLFFRPPDHLIAPDRVGRLFLVRAVNGGERNTSGTGFQRFNDFRNNTRSFDAMTPFYARSLAIGAGQEAREMAVAVSSADLWTMFDVKPVIGRFFTAEEAAPPEGAAVVVLSYAFWQTQFGGRRTVLGEVLDIGPKKYTVIGVAPRGFSGLRRDTWVAYLPIAAQMSAEGSRRWITTYGMSWFDVYARRKPGVSVEQAAADLSNAFTMSYRSQLEENPQAAPLAVAKPRAFFGPLLPARGPGGGSETKVLTWLVGVAGIVLLIACANVANLMLARALRRRREIAVRLALGVSRGRLLTQVMTESLVLATLGGVAGLAVAQWGGAIVRTAVFPGGAINTFTDVRVIACVSAIAAVAGLLTGLAPVLQAAGTDVAGALKAGSREGTVQRSRARVALLVVQATLSVVLLVGAGLFVRSLHNVQNVRLGYDADRVAWVTLNARGVTFDSGQRVAIREALVERARTLPVVEQAGRGLTVPFWSTREIDLFVSGIDSVHKLGRFTVQAASPSLLATLGTRLVRGRGITTDDRASSPRVVVVSEGMAKRLWPNEDAIGKCLRVNADTVPCSTVVGIAEDVRRNSMSEPEFHYYVPIEQYARLDGGIFVRTRGAADAHVEEIRRSLQSLMPGVSYVTVTPMSMILGYQTRSWRLGATMFTVFGSLALVLAAIGLYSVIAYNVTQRTHEMGVRVALGARGRDVIGLIVREGLLVVVPGVALGAAIALGAGRWIKPLLFDVSPSDPVVLVGVVTMLVVVAVAASWVPALRAARVDPNEALRAD